MTAYRDIVYESKDHIARITINRPKQYNAFTGDTLKELTLAFEAALCDAVFPQNAAAFDHSPARLLEGWIYMLGSCFCLVHAAAVSCPVKAWCSIDVFNASNSASMRSWVR